MKMLIELHLREKHELYQANAALRDVLQRHGSTRAKMEVEQINTEVNALKSRDVSINDVLVLSAQAEIEQLREEVASLNDTLKASEAGRVVDEPPLENKRTVLLDESTSENPMNGDLGGEITDASRSSCPEFEDRPCTRCAAMEHQASRLSIQLGTAQRETEAAETKLEDAKNRLMAAQKSQEQLLKIAQDGRLEAEKRVVLEQDHSAQLQKENDILSALNSTLKAEMHSISAKFTKVDSELRRLRADTATKADAARGISSARLAELEAASTGMNKLILSLKSQISSLERRLAVAEAEAARAASQANKLEAAAADRDSLSIRLAAAEAGFEDARILALSSSSMRELLEQSESRRMKAEEELVATGKLAADLEERLVKVAAELEASSVRAQRAEVKVSQAHASVADELVRRWESAGSNRSLWPPKALDELEAVEAQLFAVQAAYKVTQERLEHVTGELSAAQSKVRSAETEVADAQHAVQRLKYDSEQKVRRLEAAMRATAKQVDEFRAALGQLERERAALANEKTNRESAVEAATAAVAAAKLRTGSGGIRNVPQSPWTASGQLRENGAPRSGTIDATDLLYLKNVLLKFLTAYLDGRYQECEALLPAVAAVLQASQSEFKALKDSFARGSSALGWLYSNGVSS